MSFGLFFPFLFVLQAAAVKSKQIDVLQGDSKPLVAFANWYGLQLK